IEGEHHVYDFAVPTTHSFIANGIVSHNTRILAGKVVYHMEEMGLSAHQILACSFTKKSSAELIARVMQYGGDLSEKTDSQARNGFGTTHSIAKRLLMRYGKGYAKSKLLKGFEQTDLIKLAILQVMMSLKSWEAPGKDETFFTRVGAALKPSQIEAPVEPPDKARIRALGKALDVVWDFVAESEKEYGPSTWMEQVREVIRRWNKNTVDPEVMTPKQKDVINRTLGFAVQDGQTERKGTRWALRQKGMGQYRIASGEMPQYVQAAGARPTPRIDLGEGSTEDAAPTEKGNGPPWKKNIVKKHPVWGKKPAGQWFNIGASWEEFMKDGKPPKPIPLGSFLMYITKNKGRLVAPGASVHKDFAEEVANGDRMETKELKAQDVSLYSAVYGAYEWLKDATGDGQKQGDFDDMLLNACQELVADPSLLASVQRQYKMVLVDEAQDLNPCQHLFVGLMAGYYDPAT
ncbi:MAG: UvrD-helicase domain-containing protein, partial [Candidatus Pacearchaeota archaeon]|nr:UvrD-helicase domain-containing protein [Candidatus Pacearchaeota archaeon]